MTRTALLLVACFVILHLPFPSSHAVDNSHVKVGVIAPLSGNAAHVGAEIQRTIAVIGTQLAKRELNNSYEFHFEDGKAGTDNSPSTAAQKLIHIDDVEFLISASSGETLQVGPIAQRNEVLLFAVFSSHKDVKHIGDFVFRTFIDVEKGIALLSEHIRAEKDVPVAVLTEDHAFTQGVKFLLVKNLQGDIAVAEDYPENETDVRTMLHRAKMKGAKSYYLSCAHPKTCALITNQARQLGITDPLYSYLHIDNPEYLLAAGVNANGVRYLAAPDISAAPPFFKQFLTAYVQRYSHEPKNDFLARTTFDATYSMIAGIEAVGADPKAVVKFLKDYQGDGALGKVRFDENGDILNIEYVIKEIRNGSTTSAGS